MLLHNELDSVSDVFPFSNSGLLLVSWWKRHCWLLSSYALCFPPPSHSSLSSFWACSWLYWGLGGQVEGDRKGHRLALLGWVLFKCYFLSAGHFCGFFWASHPWRPLTFRFVDPLRSSFILHGHFDDSVPQSLRIKGLLASCSWNFFACPGVPPSLMPW